MSPFVALLGVFTGKLDRRWLPATWAAATIPMIPWASRFGSMLWAAAIPIGALFVQAAALWGILNRLPVAAFAGKDAGFEGGVSVNSEQ